MAYSKKKMKSLYDNFIKQYGRKKQKKGSDPNDRQYNRELEEKIKRMKPEEIQELINDDN